MRYVGASAAVLVAAMTISLTPFGRTARAFEDKPVVRSMMDRNTIVPFSASSSSTITLGIKRYMTPPKLLEGLAEINPRTCTEVAEGAWTHTPDQLCGKDANGNENKCGKITTGTEADTLGPGFCAGSTFTFATIYYEWTAHNNQSTLTAPPMSVADTFGATWTTPDGKFTQQFTFNINVPVVRPDHETTAFVGWSRTNPTFGEWQQAVVPPGSDPSFDFSGEHVHEFVAGQAGPDMCYFKGADTDPFDKIQNKPNEFWIVQSGNIYKPDTVGYSFPYVNYYRATSPNLGRFGSCGTRFGQEMEIQAPPDPPNIYTPYGSTNTGHLNALGASITKEEVTSIRAGISKTKKWPFR